MAWLQLVAAVQVTSRAHPFVHACNTQQPSIQHTAAKPQHRWAGCICTTPQQAPCHVPHRIPAHPPVHTRPTSSPCSQVGFSGVFLSKAQAFRLVWLAAHVTWAMMMGRLVSLEYSVPFTIRAGPGKPSWAQAAAADPWSNQAVKPHTVPHCGRKGTAGERAKLGTAELPRLRGGCHQCIPSHMPSTMITNSWHIAIRHQMLSCAHLAANLHFQSALRAASAAIVGEAQSRHSLRTCA